MGSCISHNETNTAVSDDNSSLSDVPTPTTLQQQQNQDASMRSVTRDSEWTANSETLHLMTAGAVGESQDSMAHSNPAVAAVGPVQPVSSPLVDFSTANNTNMSSLTRHQGGDSSANNQSSSTVRDRSHRGKNNSNVTNKAQHVFVAQPASPVGDGALQGGAASFQSYSSDTSAPPSDPKLVGQSFASWGSSTLQRETRQIDLMIDASDRNQQLL